MFFFFSKLGMSQLVRHKRTHLAESSLGIAADNDPFEFTNDGVVDIKNYVNDE